MKNHFITVFTLTKETKFGELTGLKHYYYKTFKITGNTHYQHSGGKVDASQCLDFRKYIIDEFEPYAKSHMVEQLK